MPLSTDRDKFPALDFEQARRTAENYSKSCGVPCRVINAAGETLFATDPGPGQMTICEMVSRLLPSATDAAIHMAPVLAKPKAESNARAIASASASAGTSASASVCNNAHLYGCFQAERFG
ncbi:MAG: hypothetical protein H6Q62_539, partial [Firmicutes bacterium]|nr:hypothetical protein [Bacillota bacterium]